MQEKTVKIEEISLRDYWFSLRKSEKGKLMAYLHLTYGMVPATTAHKFKESAGCRWRPLEEKVVREVIASEAWRAV